MLKILIIFVCFPAVIYSKPQAHMVYFHNHIPSNIFVNSAQGPTQILEDNPKTKLIQLFLYPSDKKSRASKSGRIVLSENNGISGVLSLDQKNPPVGGTTVSGVIQGLTEGEYFLTVSEFGDVTSECSKIGGIYNPYNLDDIPNVGRRIIGEVGNFTVEPAAENVTVNLVSPILTLVGPRSVIGRAVAIKKIEENGVGNETLTCGVIGYAQ